MKKNKKNKRAFVDDGRTVYDMSGLNPNGGKGKEPVGLSGKEKWAAIKAAFLVYGRVFILVLCGFIAAGILVWLWLK